MNPFSFRVTLNFYDEAHDTACEVRFTANNNATAYFRIRPPNGAIIVWQRLSWKDLKAGFYCPSGNGHEERIPPYVIQCVNEGLRIRELLGSPANPPHL
jgi:hypothetical protein